MRCVDRDCAGSTTDGGFRDATRSDLNAVGTPRREIGHEPAIRSAKETVAYNNKGLVLCRYLFFFQAEDGIRDSSVTGVQTCALPILVALDPNLTNDGIERWFRSVDADDRYLGSAGLVYIERVAASELTGYRSTVLADPTPGAASAFTVLPPGLRDYCFTRFEVIEVAGQKLASAFAIPLGLDWCTGLGPQLQPVTRSGGSLLLNLAPLSTALGPQIASLPADQVAKLIPAQQTL